MSLIISYVTFLFAIMKIIELFRRDHPNVMTFEDLNLEDADSWFDTSKDNFMMAFALEDYYEGTKSDPRYVKWVARHIIQVEEKMNVEFYPLEPCTPE